MTMRATVERNTATEVGDDGLPVAATFAELAVVPCWLYTQTENERIDGRVTRVIESLRMLMPRRADVTERDRINGIKNRRGEWIRSGILQIQAVIDRHDHLELALTSVE